MKRVEHLKDSFRHMLFHRYSRAESSRTRRGIEHDRDHIAPRNAFIQRLANLIHHGDVKDIERWPRESDPRDAVDNLEFDVLEFFGHHFTEAGSTTVIPS